MLLEEGDVYIIVIDLGYGGEIEIGGSLFNNVVSVLGVLEKNMCFDIVWWMWFLL